MPQVEIVMCKGGRAVASLPELPASATVEQVKRALGRVKPGLADINRQELRAEARGKGLKDEVRLDTLDQAGDIITLHLKDRGLQVGWSTVFLAEYAGPLVVYLLFYARPAVVYGPSGAAMSSTAHLAAAAWTLHYLKRLLETVFVHRFSNATMPVGNLFKNCSYYWGFTAYCAYHINHPLYTSPGMAQVYSGLSAFLLCELGNLSIHLLLRNLRPAGTKQRRIPYPDSNPLSQLQSLVSCPNYTYEIGAWFAFTVMTQCLAAGLFTLAGAYQMVVWAQGKHRNYRKEFKDYPRRKAIIPFVL